MTSEEVNSPVKNVRKWFSAILAGHFREISQQRDNNRNAFQYPERVGT